MFNKIRTRLILIIISAIVFSIISISLIIHYTLSNKFDIYLKEEQQNTINNIIELIETNYKNENSWSIKSLENIKSSPVIREYDILIKDENENIVLKSEMASSRYDNHMDTMNEMMESMNKRMGNLMGTDNSFGKYNSQIHEIIVYEQKVGQVEIGYIGPFMVSERELDFILGINTSIFYAALVSIIVALIIGAYFSNHFSKPISKITNAANDIRKGDLDTVVNSTTNITELNELTQSINHLSKTLKHQQILRKRLTSDISHELRTPLTILQSHLEAINDGIWEPTKERLDNFNNEVKRLIKLVEELKYLNDIENHKIILNIDKINISELIKEVIKNFDYKSKTKNIDITHNINEDIYIHGDKYKINQIFINVLSNALKFTNDNGKISVNLSNNIDNIIVEIKDNGIGMKSEDLPYIFERLYRSDPSRNRKTGGSGIGLTITKNLVKAHGGYITVESEENIGTKFIITLPKK